MYGAACVVRTGGLFACFLSLCKVDGDGVLSGRVVSTNMTGGHRLGDALVSCQMSWNYFLLVRTVNIHATRCFLSVLSKPLDFQIFSSTT